MNQSAAISQSVNLFACNHFKTIWCKILCIKVVSWLVDKSQEITGIKRIGCLVNLVGLTDYNTKLILFSLLHLVDKYLNHKAENLHLFA